MNVKYEHLIVVAITALLAFMAYCTIEYYAEKETIWCTAGGNDWLWTIYPSSIEKEKYDMYCRWPDGTSGFAKTTFRSKD